MNYSMNISSISIKWYTYVSKNFIMLVLLTYRVIHGAKVVFRGIQISDN